MTSLHEQSPATYFLRLNNLETFVELVGAKPLHLLSQTVLPLKSPTGAFIASQTRSMCFERSGRGQEPSRGHKFSILENFLSIRDFTSAMRLHFRSDLVGVALVGATPLHLLSQTALPLKSPTGAFIAALRKRGPTPNPAHIRTLRCEGTECRAYITSPRSYRTDRRYNDQNECSTDS